MLRLRKAKHRHTFSIAKAASGTELSARRLLNNALRTLEPRLAVAFGRAAQSIIKRPDLLAELTAAIESGDMNSVERLVGAENLSGALRGQGLSPNVATFTEEVMEAMKAGGKAAQVQLGPNLARASASLNLTNPQAVDYLARQLPAKIREVSTSSQEAVQQALLRGFQEGRPAKQIAREVRNAVGLTRNQETYVSNFRRQLESGELGGTTSPLDRRLSAVERRQAEQMRLAALEGNPAAQERIDAMVDRYHASLVNRRAQDIARTETMNAFGEGKRELWRQAEERGLIDPAKTRRHWLVTDDARLRDDHRAVPGMNPDGIGMNDSYNTPIGPVRGPRLSGDPAFDVNCRCDEYLTFED